MDITFSYKLLRKNSVLYRGVELENKLSQHFNPYYRGLYLGPKLTASYYGNVNKYKTKQTLYFLIINKSNLKKIINIIKTKLQKGLTFLDGSKLYKKDALYVIREYSSINKDKIKIDTGKKGLYKFGKDISYLGLWFAKIICFFGFDGYYVPKTYMRKYTKNIFHEEYYFCFPQIHLNKLIKIKNNTSMYICLFIKVKIIKYLLFNII